MSISNNEFPQGADESDSEINLDDDNNDYYQPISSGDESSDDSDPNPSFQMLSNGQYTEPETDEEEEEKEVIEEATNSEISRAFREDDDRRKAPLTPENSNRIMDAMRGVSLQGFVPDWSNQVSESHWIDQLSDLRRQQQQPLYSSSTTTTTGITDT